MSTIINADTSDGLKFTSDTSGEIKLQSAGTDIATVDSSGITLATGKDLTLSSTALDASASGIYLGGTAEANLLDDYEYGTFTPNLSQGGSSLTVAAQSGQYVKVGKMVFAYMQIGNITRSGAGDLSFDLPFVVDGVAIGNVQWNRITFAANDRYITLYALNDTSSALMYFIQTGNSNAQTVIATDIADAVNADVVASIVYKTD